VRETPATTRTGAPRATDDVRAASSRETATDSPHDQSERFSKKERAAESARKAADEAKAAAKKAKEGSRHTPGSKRP
jgi:hypothetical protein